MRSPSRVVSISRPDQTRDQEAGLCTSTVSVLSTSPVTVALTPMPATFTEFCSFTEDQ
ncbi:hypothetical protein D3C83_312050 [compost metagenome]